MAGMPAHFCAAFNVSAEDYIGGGFMNRIRALFSDDERAFILDTCEKFERVKLGFAYFSLIRSNLRPLEARILRHNQLRSGWLRVGVPSGFAQSVADHEDTCRKLALLLFFDDPELALIEDVAAYHDSGEPVIGDFTPHDPIARADKRRIETLAVRLVCASALQRGNEIAQRIARALEVYEGESPEHADIRAKLRDCDLLEMCVEAIHILQNCPEGERQALAQHLQEFWDYTGTRLTTDRAKHFFDSLKTARFGSDSALSDVIAHAHQYMLLHDPDPLQADGIFRSVVVMRTQGRLTNEGTNVTLGA